MNDLQALTALEEKFKEQKKLQESIEQNTKQQIENSLENLTDDLKKQNKQSLNGLKKDMLNEQKNLMNHLMNTEYKLVKDFLEKLDSETEAVLMPHSLQYRQLPVLAVLGIGALFGSIVTVIIYKIII